MNENQILHHICHKNVGEWRLDNIRDKAKLVIRIIRYNMVPKTGSYDQIFPFPIVR